MNIVLQSPAIRTPLKALWNWLTETPRSMKCTQVGQHSAPFKEVGQIPVATSLRSQMLTDHAPVPARRDLQRPLRTVRVLEVNQAPGHVGRMVMSGRMADVCAELDRMVACEGRLH
jgi:hypothetical protein